MPSLARKLREPCISFLETHENPSSDGMPPSMASTSALTPFQEFLPSSLRIKAQRGLGQKFSTRWRPLTADCETSELNAISGHREQNETALRRGPSKVAGQRAWTRMMLRNSD